MERETPISAIVSILFIILAFTYMVPHVIITILQVAPIEPLYIKAAFFISDLFEILVALVGFLYIIIIAIKRAIQSKHKANGSSVQA